MVEYVRDKHFEIRTMVDTNKATYKKKFVLSEDPPYSPDNNSELEYFGNIDAMLKAAKEWYETKGRD